LPLTGFASSVHSPIIYPEKQKAKRSTKVSRFHSQITERVVDFLPDSNIRVDMVPITAAEYSNWSRHRWDESVTWITEPIE
jgi:hypothetical protein